MLFISVQFLLFFLPATLIGYQLMGRFGRRAVVRWLVLMSLVFYAWWRPVYLLLLLASILLNYLISMCIARAAEDRNRRMWMFIGVAVNLGLLAYYKYLFPLLHFFHEQGWTQHTWAGVVLPLGISFFTFTQIAYLVDLAQGQAERPGGLAEYALFVTFFPHLIAGPILHHREMMPQFLKNRRYRLAADDVLIGLSWFVLGFAKKSILADHLGLAADRAFQQVSGLSTADAWIGSMSYALQLYFDFSGYSDMAIGLARMFSIRFPLNFNSPYKAASIIEFWDRWHMTLTRYLTLYLYSPLSLIERRRRLAAGKGISRSAQRTPGGFTQMLAWPTIFTMFLAGIWHGAGLQFIIFGLLHGLYLTVNHAWRILVRPPAANTKTNPVAHASSVLLTFICALVAEIFFRANSTTDAVTLLSHMAGFGHAAVPHLFSRWEPFVIALLFAIVWSLPNTQQILGQTDDASGVPALWRRFSFRPSWSWAMTMAALLVACILLASNSARFLYFQF